MPRYRITTLIDITRTATAKSPLTDLQIKQQANFDSLRQAIELRSNVEWNRDPAYHEGALPEPFDGRGAYWTWEFEIEQEELFKKGDNPIGLLIDDMHGVPIVNQLLNSKDIDPAAFQTHGENQNIWIEII
jgi:hypothetical protein